MTEQKNLRVNGRSEVISSPFCTFFSKEATRMNNLTSHQLIQLCVMSQTSMCTWHPRFPHQHSEKKLYNPHTHTHTQRLCSFSEIFQSHVSFSVSRIKEEPITACLSRSCDWVGRSSSRTGTDLRAELIQSKPHYKTGPWNSSRWASKK